MDRITTTVILLYLNVYTALGVVPTKQLNMESTDCDIGQYLLSDQDIYRIWGNPPFTNAGTGTRDRCVITLRTKVEGRLLKIKVAYVQFNDNGIHLNVYDYRSPVTPKYVLTSDSGPADWELRPPVKFELIKQSTAARTYRVDILVTTDQGPDIGFEQSVNDYQGQTLTIGAIVGIAIGGGLFVLALIGICIYCIVKFRRKRLSKEREAASVTAGSTVYSSSKEKYYSDSKVHIGRDFMPPKRVPSSRTYSSQHSQSDHKDTEIFIVKDQYGNHPATFKNNAFSRDSSSGGLSRDDDNFDREARTRRSYEKSKEYPVYDNYDRRVGKDSKPQSVKSGEFRRGDARRQSAGKSRRYPTSDESDRADGRNFKTYPSEVKREMSKRQAPEKKSYKYDTRNQPPKYDEFDNLRGTYSRSHSTKRDNRHSAAQYEEYEPRRSRNYSTKDDRNSARYEDYDFHRREHSTNRDEARRSNPKRQSVGRDPRRETGSVKRSHSPYREEHYPQRPVEKETRHSPANVSRQNSRKSSYSGKESLSRKGKQPTKLGDLNINSRYGNRGQLPKR